MYMVCDIKIIYHLSLLYSLVGCFAMLSTSFDYCHELHKRICFVLLVSGYISLLCFTKQKKWGQGIRLGHHFLSVFLKSGLKFLYCLKTIHLHKSYVNYFYSYFSFNTLPFLEWHLMYIQCMPSETYFLVNKVSLSH